MSAVSGAVPRIGDVLLQKEYVSPDDIERALERQRATGEYLGEALVALGVLTAEKLADVLAEQHCLERVSGFAKNPPAAGVPDAMVLRHRVFPVRFEEGGKKLYLATADPLDVRALDEVRFVTGAEVVPVVAVGKEIDRAIRAWYGAAGSGGETFGSAGEEEEEEREGEEEHAEGPVVRLAQAVVEGALAEGASDVHIEPRREGASVRYRVDGVLRDVMSVPRRMHAALVSRFKVMAGMDVAEKRVPQDGRIGVRSPRSVDLRVSTLPVSLGEKTLEKMVLRILDKSKTAPRLEALGYSGENLERLRRAVRLPYGMILVTGPTGCGKTTTLYAALSEVVSAEVNVVTVEDPPEYEMPGVSQVQVNPKAGVTFASALRAILRQDPDVIMVGEIRDRETAQIAVRAALCGHLVFSTMHTNDAASTPARLVDMGVEPYLAASCLLCVAAQRLVRVVCPECAVEREVSEAAHLFAGERARYGKGCRRCEGTGFRGRTALTEVMRVSKAIREAVRRNASADEIREIAVAEGMALLADDAARAVRTGLTTPEEALKAVASAVEA